MDVIGPQFNEHINNGNNWLIFKVGWVTSTNVARLRVNHVINLWSSVDTTHVSKGAFDDNGAKICNLLMDIVVVQMNVKHVTTSHYHPPCNNLTKHFNRTMCSLLEENRTYENNTNDILHEILFAYMTNVHFNNDVSPFDLLYGRKPILPIHVHMFKFNVWTHLRKKDCTNNVWRWSWCLRKLHMHRMWVISVTDTSRKHGRKEPQSFVHCLDHHDMQSLNDYIFLFFVLRVQF
jgi:hypothetical protein